MISNEIINHGSNSKYPTVKREIKFRAWDKDNECWIPFDSDEYIWQITEKGIHIEALETTWTADGGDPREVTGYTPIKAEVMQFTGLVDKKESELYEDDIIDITRHEERTRHQIIWKEGGWQLNPPGPFPTQYLGCFKSAIIEKKGNIFENKAAS